MFSSLRVFSNVGSNLGRLCSIAALFVMSLIAITGCMGYHPIAHSSWDARVKDFCLKEGGVVVYEKVKLDEEELRLLGARRTITVPRRQSAGPSAPYIADEKITWLNEGNPRVYRADISIVRTRDGKVLSHMVSFGRVGGDLVPPYSCADVGVNLDIEQQTFALPRASQ